MGTGRGGSPCLEIRRRAQTSATMMSVSSARMLPGGQPNARTGRGTVGMITATCWPAAIGCCGLVLILETSPKWWIVGGGWWMVQKGHCFCTIHHPPPTIHRFSTPLAPQFILADHFCPAAARPIRQPRPKLVLAFHLIA